MTSLVAINARFLTQSIMGAQRYATELVKAIDRLIDRGAVDPGSCRFVLVAPRDVKHGLDLKHIPLERVGRLRGHLWEQLELPFYTRGDLLVSLGSVAPLLKRNQVVTIHDAAVFANPPTFYSLKFRAWHKVLSLGLGKTARKIVTVSSFSKADLNRRSRIAEDKMRVIYEGNEHVFAAAADEAVLRKHGLDLKPFILAVSSLNPNKNFRSIARAVELLGDVGLDVVVAGGTIPRVFGRNGDSLPDGIKHVGYVSDGELRALYENAACFVYPSFYEGFGLPPLEAMACGCPAIVSNTASLPEVCGDAALYCDPHSPADIADKIRLLTADESLREDLRNKGMERARQFTWDKCAEQTVDVIERMLRTKR